MIFIASIKKLDSEGKSCDEDSGNSNANNSSSSITNIRPEKSAIKSVQREENKLLRRAASTKFRHHREGVVVADVVGSISNISDILLKRLGSIKYVDESPLPNVKHMATNIEGEKFLDQSDTQTSNLRDEAYELRFKRN